VELWNDHQHTASIELACDFKLNVRPTQLALESTVDALTYLIDQDNTDLADLLIQKYAVLAKTAIKKSKLRKQGKWALKLFSKFKLDPEEFPEVEPRQIVELTKTLTIRFFLNKPNGAVQLLDLLSRNTDHLGKMLEFVVYRCRVHSDSSHDHVESACLAKYLVSNYPELRDKVAPQTWEKVKSWQVEPFTLKPDSFEPYEMAV
jgi:hypothetical protein